MIFPENEDEEGNIEELKSRVGDLKIDDDVTLLRFLRARDQNLDKAENMLRRCMQWRSDVEVARYVTWKPAKCVEEDSTFHQTGTDYEGRPVFWLPMGRWNTRGLLEQGYKDDVTKLRYYVLETLMHKIINSEAHQCMVIFGVEGLTYWKVAHLETMQLMMDSFRDLAMNYPEIIKKMFVVNTPWYFPYVLKFVKPILSQRTTNKLHIFNGDKAKWLPVLLEAMPRAALPPEYLEDVDEDLLKEWEEQGANKI